MPGENGGFAIGNRNTSERAGTAIPLFAHEAAIGAWDHHEWGLQDFSCMSLSPPRIMPLIFGNRFPWEISQETNRRLGTFLPFMPDCRRTYQGSGDPNALP
jgi:hypothetical protein